MAKQNEIAYQALNVGIVAGMIVGIYFLYKWLKNHVGGNGGTLFGGSGKEPTSGNGSGAQNSGPSDFVTKLAKKAEED
jgi:hypothetical protein